MPRLTGEEGTEIAYLAESRDSEGIRTEYETEIKSRLSPTGRELAEQILGVSKSSNQALIDDARAVIQWADKNAGYFAYLKKK